RGKENGVNILKSIDEGPYRMGTVRETRAESTEGAPQFGPKRPRVYSDLTPEEKDRYNADIWATNILLQGLPKDIYTLINHYTDAKDIWDNVKMLLEGSELTKEDRESQLYDDFKHFRQHKGESIHSYYVRFAKLINDMRNIKMTMSRLQLNSKFVNNMLPEWGRFVTTVKLNRGLRDSNYDQLYAYLKQHETHAQENKMMLEHFSQPTVDPLALIGQGVNPRGGNAVGYGGAQNRVGNVNSGQARPAQENGVALDAEQLLFLTGGHDNAFNDDVDDCDAFDSNVDEASTAQTMFMANLSSADPVTDEAGPSYDSNILSEVPDHDHYQDAACVHHEEHVMHDSVQLDHAVDSHADYTTDSNMIPYDQYVKDNEVPVVHSDVSSVPNDAFMMIYNDMCESHAQSVFNPSRNIVVKNSLTAELATYKEHVELPKPHYNELNKVAIGYKNPLCLTRTKQVQLALYNGHEIIKDNHTPAIVHNTEDILEIAEITRKKMNDKINDPECVTRKALTKEIKEMKDVFEELEAEVAQYAVDRKHDAIERKNLLIANDNLIVECLSQEVFSVATNSELNVARFTKMHVANTTVKARCLALEAELANLRDKSHHDNQEELINQFSKLEVNHLNLQLKYLNLKDNIGNNPPTPDKDTPDFDSVFIIGKMQASLQGKDNVIRQLKKQLSQLQVTRSDTDRTLKVQTTNSQITKLTDQVTNLQAQNDLFRNIRDAHLDYLRHLKEIVETIRDIVEEAKVKVKQVWKPKQVRQVWKPTGKVLTTIGHQWRPTYQILNLGKQFPLTRFTLPKVVSATQNKKRANCSKHMTGDRSRLMNFVKEFIGIVRFGNDHFGVIMGYGDYVNGNSVISRVYYVEGLGHNLFSVGQFCDSNLEVAFRKHSCYVRDTDGVALIKGSRGSNLYTISVEDVMKSSPICLLSKASKNKSWLWHRCLNYLNFGTINDLARKDLFQGLPRLKFEKDHLCSA
nr:integrase, catalytic region, zinc finger, CCHC-type, peptidase aspartic, catalytic [Tanacetum cinerariifolium]